MGTVVYFQILTESSRFISESQSPSPRSADPQWCSFFNWSHYIVDDRKLKGCGFICLQRKIVFKNITKEQIWNSWEKQIPWWFNINYNKNKIIVVDKCTIAANEPTQVYLAIILIRTILITNHRDKDHRTLKCDKHAPFYSSNH